MSGAEAARAEFLGLHFDRLDVDAARSRVIELAGEPRFSYVVTPNVDHIVRLERDPDAALIQAYEKADICLCDSRILARLASVSGLRLEVVPGSDLTRDLLVSGMTGGRIAVVGGDERLHAALAAAFSRFDWRFHEPPMGVRTNPGAREAIARFVEESRAGLTLFAIGAPQSELVCAAIAARGRARGTALCIGASLEFLTGAKTRAPHWMQRARLEWLFRLLSEPRRLWRRYLVEGPRIFVIWQRWERLRADRVPSAASPSGDG